ncbi:MAG: Luciferase-like monooxygenase [Microbacteriaceae bacterium]|nr:Luciferase-like monooxygenase [Microbacteriaceae bacterium]
MPNEPVTLLPPSSQQDPKNGFTLAFLTNGAFTPEGPGGAKRGHKEIIDLFKVAEQLGYDRGWVRNRHFDNYSSSPLTIIAAAAQHTSRIRLGTAIIPVGYEDPIRLAEDAATVDLLADERLELGIATGIPGFGDIFGSGVGPQDFKRYAGQKVERFLDAIGGTVLGRASVEQGKPAVAADLSAERLHGPSLQDPAGTGIPYYARPYSESLRGRIWYGPGSVESAEVAARQGLDLLMSAIGPAIGLGFEAGQRAQIDAHRAAWTRTDRAPRSSASRLFFPFVNDRQRRLYQDYADLRNEYGPAASRPPGALAPVPFEERSKEPAAKPVVPGLLSPVVVAEPAEIIEYLRSDVAVQAAGELSIFLPPGFTHAENLELLENIATLVASQLGWTPSSAVLA